MQPSQKQGNNGHGKQAAHGGDHVQLAGLGAQLGAVKLLRGEGGHAGAGHGGHDHKNAQHGGIKWQVSHSQHQQNGHDQKLEHRKHIKTLASQHGAHAAARQIGADHHHAQGNAGVAAVAQKAFHRGGHTQIAGKDQNAHKARQRAAVQQLFGRAGARHQHKAVGVEQGVHKQHIEIYKNHIAAAEKACDNGNAHKAEVAEHQHILVNAAALGRKPHQAHQHKGQHRCCTKINAAQNQVLAHKAAAHAVVTAHSARKLDHGVEKVYHQRRQLAVEILVHPAPARAGKAQRHQPEKNQQLLKNYKTIHNKATPYSKTSILNKYSILFLFCEYFFKIFRYNTKKIDLCLFLLFRV